MAFKIDGKLTALFIIFMVDFQYLSELMILILISALLIYQ